MFARYGGAFAISFALHAIIAVALAWPAFSPASRRSSGHPVEVVLLPPIEDTQFPGLKPVPDLHVD